MNNSFIILAAGESKRFNSKIPKPYQMYRGKPLLIHTIDKVKKYKNIEILLVDKFIGERGRINCSLREKNGFWRWLGIQFVIAEK